MTGPGRPVPVPDPGSEPFWAAAAQGTLAIARCSRCSAYTHPPDVVCQRCGSTDPRFEWTPVSGRGTIRSWTVIRQSFLPGFDQDVPFALVDVELEEQDDLRIIGRLLDGPDSVIRPGAPVTVSFETVTSAVRVPAFTLSASR